MTTEAASTTGGATGEPAAPAPALIGNAVQQIIARAAAKKAAPAAVPATPSASADAPASSPAAAESPKPDPEPKPAGEGDSLKLARALADGKKYQTELAAARKELETLKAQGSGAAQDLEKLRTRAKENPIRLAEELSGLSFKQILEKVRAGEFDAQPELPEHVRKELEESKKFREQLEKQRQTQQKAAQRAADLGVVKDFLGKHESALLKASPDAADALLERAYAHLEKTGEQPDLSELAAELETHGKAHLKSILTNEALLQALASDAEVRQKVGKAFGLELSKPAPASSEKGKSNADSPRTLTHNLTQDAPVPSDPTRPKSEAEQQAESLARLQAWKRRMNGSP